MKEKMMLSIWIVFALVFIGTPYVHAQDSLKAPKIEKPDTAISIIALYSAAKEPVLVDVPVMKFLMIDGTGDPNVGTCFQEAIQALYGLAFTIRFMVKDHQWPKDFMIPPLEGLWWTADSGEFDYTKRGEWKWTAMLMMPEFITSEMLAAAVKSQKEKKDDPTLAKVRLEEFREGKSAQVLHVGPYSAERPTIEALHEFIKAKGFQRSGKHHEIYLGDPRSTPPESLQTILRQGVK